MTNMVYDPMRIKYLNGTRPSLLELEIIMDKYPRQTYLAICDYLSEIIWLNAITDIEKFEEKYYTRPVDTCTQPHYLTSYYFLALYYYKQRLSPEKALKYVRMALLERASYDSASALLITFYLEGYGVPKDREKAREIWLKAKEEIATFPCRIEIDDLSVFNMEL